MKKVIISLVLSIIVIFSLTVSASAAYYGDVDGSGKVTASDARIILRVAAKMDTISDDKVIFADANRDGRITAADARTVLRMAAKLEDFVEITTSGTEPSTRPPETTTKAPETTTKAPETTTKTPETTTKTPETTTKTPETTTKAPEPPSSLTAIEVHDIASKYTVEIIAKKENSKSIGSGFFISEDGKVVTNYHVIDGKTSISISDYNGNIYNVTHVLAYDESMDIAILKANVMSTPAILNYKTPRTGAVVYTLGSSKGLTDTFTDGIISNASRVVESYNPNMTYIQTTAPITNGNSGGPLINENAEVIGINTWGKTDGQNLNFAIPVKYINELDYSNPLTVEDFAALFIPKVKLIPSLSVLKLCKGGSALIFVEIEGDIKNYTLIAEFPNNAIKIYDDWYINSNTGNKVAAIFVSGLNYSSSENINLYIEGMPETTVLIPVSITKAGWIDYGGDSGVIDYGAYTGVAPYLYYLSDDADYTEYYYRFSDLVDAGISAEYGVSGFWNYLENNGFEYYETKTDDNGNEVDVFYNEKLDMFYLYRFVYDSIGNIEFVSIGFMYV